MPNIVRVRASSRAKISLHAAPDPVGFYPLTWCGGFAQTPEGLSCMRALLRPPSCALYGDHSISSTLPVPCLVGTCFNSLPCSPCHISRDPKPFSSHDRSVDLVRLYHSAFANNPREHGSLLLQRRSKDVVLQVRRDPRHFCHSILPRQCELGANTGRDPQAFVWQHLKRQRSQSSYDFSFAFTYHRSSSKDTPARLLIAQEQGLSGLTTHHAATPLHWHLF